MLVIFFPLADLPFLGLHLSAHLFEGHAGIFFPGGVYEMNKAFAQLRVVHHFFPFTGIAVYQGPHFLFPLRCHAQAVLHDDIFQIRHSPFHFIEPGGGTGERVGCSDIEHEEAVQVTKTGLLIDIGSQQLVVLRFGASVTAYIEVPSFFRSDDAKVLALRLGAFPDTAAYAALDLMRRPDPPVSFLRFDGKRYAVVQAKTAPGTAHATFHRPKRFPVGVTAFESGPDQFLPDIRQVSHMGTEQIDPLAAGDLGIEVIFFGYFSQHDQFLGGDLPPGNTGHYGIGASFLDIRQVAVITVLYSRLLQDIIIPAARQDTGYDGLADFAAIPFAPAAQRLIIGPHIVQFHQVKDFLPGMIEMFADNIADILSIGLHRTYDQVFHQGDAASAAGARFGTFFHGFHGMDTLLRYSLADRLLGDGFAGADQRFIRQVHHAGTPFCSAPAAQDQFFRIRRQQDLIIYGLQ